MEGTSLSESGSKKVALLFRSKEDIALTSKEFERWGISTIPFEAIESKCLSASSGLNEIAMKADYLIFISRNSVICSAPNINVGSVKARTIATGVSTSKLLEGMGFNVEFAPVVGGMSAVLEWLGNDSPGRVGVLCEKRSRFDFTPLEKKGFSFDKVEVYEAHARKIKIDSSEVLAATHAALFSPLEVESIKLSSSTDTLTSLRKLKAVCLGKKTYESASPIFDRVALARENSISSVADEIAGDLD